MNAILLICPQCGRRLTVSSNAPARLTCPSCLSRIENPTAANSPPPLPVIPLEYEVHQDHAASTVVIIVLASMIAAGLAYFAINPPHDMSGYAYLGFAVLIMAGIGGVIAVIANTRGDKTRMATGIVAVTLTTVVAVPLIGFCIVVLIFLSACGVI